MIDMPDDEEASSKAIEITVTIDREMLNEVLAEKIRKVVDDRIAKGLIRPREGKDRQ